MNDIHNSHSPASAMLPGGLLAPSLAEGAQLMVLSGFTAGPPAAPVRVVLDQRGTRMVLVLASYETVAWQLDVRPGTVLAAVVVSAYRDVAVAGHGAAPAFRLALPCAPTPGSAAYQDLMQILQARLGRGQPDLFRGYERLPEQVAIAAGGPVVGAVLPSQARMRRQLHTWQAAGQDVLHARRQTAGATPGRTAPLTASAAARRAWA